MPPKHRCRVDLIRAHQIASGLNLTEYASKAGISESTLRKALKGDGISPLSISTLATFVGVAPAALIQPLSHGPAGSTHDHKHEFRLDLTLECSSRSILDMKRVPDLIKEALARLAIPGLAVFRHSAKATLTESHDALLRIPLRLVAMAEHGNVTWPCSVYYATIRPSLYDTFLEHLTRQSLHVKDVTKFGELILWGDSRIRFDDETSLLDIFTGQPSMPEDPKSFFGFSPSIVGSQTSPVDAECVQMTCVVDFSSPAARRRYLPILKQDIANIAESLARGRQ